MDQAERVNKFECRSSFEEAVQAGAEPLRSGQKQGRSKTLAAGKDRVAHGFMQSLRSNRFRQHDPVQSTVDLGAHQTQEVIKLAQPGPTRARSRRHNRSIRACFQCGRRQSLFDQHHRNLVHDRIDQFGIPDSRDRRSLAVRRLESVRGTFRRAGHKELAEGRPPRESPDSWGRPKFPAVLD